MNTDIDEATGLPTLPEGLFYRVERIAVHVKRDLGPTDWSGRHPGPGAEDVEARGEEVVSLTKTRPWYLFGFPLQIEHHTVVTQYRALRVTEHVATYREAEGKPGEHVDLYNPTTGESNRHTLVPVTPENLLRFAEGAKKRAEDVIAQEDLLGDYPPKRFEASA